MSLYNMLFGKNAQADLLLAVVGLKECDVERFRDVYTDEGGKHIIIYTRTGGGNREHYPQDLLYENPLFASTSDDNFDNTYCDFVFRTPDEFVSDVQNLSDVLTYGLRPEFAQHLAATLRREPTERDLESAAYEQERYVLGRTKHEMLNGHTFVPHDDAALKAALTLAEANGGELRTAWGILPAKLVVTCDTEHWGAYRRVDVRAAWETDADYWAHVQEKFSAEFPLSVEGMRKDAERHTKVEGAS